MVHKYSLCNNSSSYVLLMRMYRKPCSYMQLLQTHIFHYKNSYQVLQVLQFVSGTASHMCYAWTYVQWNRKLLLLIPAPFEHWSCTCKHIIDFHKWIQTGFSIQQVPNNLPVWSGSKMDDFWPSAIIHIWTVFFPILVHLSLYRSNKQQSSNFGRF